MTAAEFSSLLAEASKLGREAGTNAAAWWEQDAIGGRATSPEDREHAALTLQGIEDGDPMVMDSLPYPNLSGEWAGDPTPRTLMAELGCEDVTPEEESDLCDAWSEAASEASIGEVERMCREFLA